MRMLKIACVFWAVLLVSTPALAAPLKAVALKGGVYNGNQDYDFGGQKLFSPDSRWSGTGGLSLEWKFGRRTNFRLLTEAIYMPKDIQQEIIVVDNGGQPTGETITQSGGLNYLSVPVLAKLQTADQASNLYFLVGFSADFILNRDHILVFDDFHKTVISAQVGIGLDNAFTRHIGGLVEFRYIQNVMNAYGGGDLGTDIRLNSIRQRGFCILVGVRLLSS
ncbi:MAG TPA: outer membrane beta-barrel protein [Candidatus Krumholzibacteria bacterium]|nr:outer membrane beta-barrel protein [Candidatus Krumholzibacteria bacterium]